VRFHREGDLAAREQLVVRFLPLARQLARRYNRGGDQLEDLVQVASLGLIKAIDRFDPGREIAFSSFAVPTIAGELKRYFRDKGWSVHVPRDLQELALKVERLADEMSRELGRAPTPAEIAERTGKTAEEVLEAREASGARRAASLDASRTDDPENGNTYADVFGAEDPGYRAAEASATVQGLMWVLPERDREVLRLRFQEDLTQSEIAARIGVSQMHVSRLIRRSIQALRDAAGASADSAPL
jgi:RNA polymerase sigma-B factor